MKKLLIGGAVAALVVAVAPALAQVAPPPGVASGTTPAPAPRAAPQVQMRVMSDRTMTRDEVVSHVRDMFARFDTNKDGYVTRDELSAFHDKMAGMHGDIEKRLGDRGMLMDRGAAFDRLDTNHDGSISRQEFTAAHGGHLPRDCVDRLADVVVIRAEACRTEPGTTAGSPGDPVTAGAPEERRGQET